VVRCCWVLRLGCWVSCELRSCFRGDRGCENCVALGSQRAWVDISGSVSYVRFFGADLPRRVGFFVSIGGCIVITTVFTWECIFMAVSLPEGRVVDFEQFVSSRFFSGSWASRRDALLVGAGLAGLRWVEASGLRRADLLPEGMVVVRTAKGGIPRQVLLGELWYAAVRALWDVRPNTVNGLAFYGWPKASALKHSGMLRRLKPWTKRVCDHEYTFHSLRHTAACRMFRATGSVVAVMRLLGHRSLQHTTTYLRSLERSECVEGLPSFVAGVQPTLRLFVGESPRERIADDVALAASCGVVGRSVRESVPVVLKKKPAMLESGSAAGKDKARQVECEHEWRDVVRGDRVCRVCASCGRVYGYYSDSDAQRLRPILERGGSGSSTRRSLFDGAGEPAERVKESLGLAGAFREQLDRQGP